MSKKSNIYFILSYLFFLFAPLSVGLALIYYEDFDDLHIPGLIINIFIIMAWVITLEILYRKRKIPKPDESEWKFLLFGFISNIVVYFYTFQYSLHIESFFTMYLGLILILLAYYLIVNRVLKAKELWLFASLFLIIDNILWLATNYNYDSFNAFNQPASLFVMFIYILIPLLGIGWFAYKIYTYNRYNFLKYINIFIVLFLGIRMQFSFFEAGDNEMKIYLTLGILAPFLTITDFIINKVNKTLDAYGVLFYLRTYTIFIILSLFGGEEILSEGMLSQVPYQIMVFTLYASILCVVIESNKNQSRIIETKAKTDTQTLERIIPFTHKVIQSIIGKDDIVIDATCGNGNDTLFLAKQAKYVYAFDIQEQAINSSKELLNKYKNVEFILDSHSNMDQYIQSKVKVIMFNLGYLPSYDKTITTLRDTTLEAIEKGFTLLSEKGLMAITIYPGHDEGKVEAEAIETYTKALSSKEFSVLKYQFTNRKDAPYTLLIEKH